MPYLAPGCFGKLPFWPEYLEENAAYPTSRSMKNWILEGRKEVGLAGGNVEEARPNETRSRRFVFGAPGSVDLTVGVIRPSHDQGGRICPFMVHAHVPRRHHGRHYALLPMALEPVWDALDDTWDSLAGVASQTAFREALSSTLVPGPAPVLQMRPHYESMQRESFSRLSQRGDGARLEALLGNLPGVVARLRREKGASAMRLEMPVSRDGSFSAFETAFWIDLLNRQFHWRRLEPTIFLDEGPAAGDFHVLLVFGMMTPSDYALVMGCGVAVVDAVRPAEGPQPQTPEGESPSAALTYAELLSRRLAGGT